MWAAEEGQLKQLCQFVDGEFENLKLTTRKEKDAWI